MSATNAPDLAQARAAKIAGALYVITNATAIAGLAIRSLVASSGDATTAGQQIMSGERLYRISIVLDLVTVGGVVALVWALYVLLRPVSKDLALLAVLFRIIENAVLAVTAVSMLLALRILARPDYLNTFEPIQLDSLSRLARGTQGLGFTVGFIFLGLGSTIFAYLLLKGRYVPRWLAGWGIFASSLFVLCTLLMIVFPSAAQVLQIVSFAPMGIYEVGLGAWLWLRGADITPRAEAPQLP